jgi:GTP cyclohydrolase I
MRVEEPQMNAPEKMPLPDVQSSADARNLAIQSVGIKGLRHPVQVAAADGPQPTVADIDMFVALPATQKGTHMSRFVELLQAWDEPLSVTACARLLQAMLEKLEAAEGRIAVSFPFFVRKAAPVSGARSLMDYRVTLSAEQRGTTRRIVQQVIVPVTSLCPCSKDISDYGAHNQRSHVTVDAELAADWPLEAQIRLVESAASSELWAVLKRADEKYVTERAYDNPKFVEDTVRDLALLLQQEEGIKGFTVACENFEAIHNHSAYAAIERR